MTLGPSLFRDVCLIVVLWSPFLTGKLHLIGFRREWNFLFYKMELRLQNLKQSFCHCPSPLPPHLPPLQANNKSVPIVIVFHFSVILPSLRWKPSRQNLIWTGCTAYCQDIDSEQFKVWALSGAAGAGCRTGYLVTLIAASSPGPSLPFPSRMFMGM